MGENHSQALAYSVPSAAGLCSVSFHSQQSIPLVRRSQAGLILPRASLNEKPGRMLKKSASDILAALGGSTYRTEYASAFSLAAAALDSLL